MLTVVDDVGSILTLATEEAFVISSGVPFDSIAPCVIPVKEGMGGSAALHKAKFLGASYVCHELEVHTSPFCRARVNRVLPDSRRSRRNNYTRSKHRNGTARFS